jgi:hypothetical protein
MGSLLNFVFLKNTLESNGKDDNSITGPLFWYVSDNNLSYTLNGEIKQGYKNLLLIEGKFSLWSFLTLESDIINFINNNDVKLLACSLADPTHLESYLEVKEHLENVLPNKHYIVDSNTALKGCFTLDYFLEDAVRSKQLMFETPNDLKYKSEEIQISELNNFREKKFLSFNRNVDRRHRTTLLYEYLTNDYSDSYFSFLGRVEFIGDVMMFGEIKDYDFFNSKLPIELDTQRIDDKMSFNISNTFKKDLFLNSCINLVTETSFDNNELFISEKVIKPIVSYQPFILFGPYGYLKQLKSYGFKTFSDFWDEGYDEIENPEERMEALLKLVREMNSKSINELNALYQKTKENCIYNKEHFNSLDLDEFPSIFKKIENEW